MVSSLIAQRWVKPQLQWWHWLESLLCGWVSVVCLWLALLWLNSGFSLALTVNVVRALFFVSAQYVNWSGLEVIKLEFILRLKVKCNDWLLADTCPQSANHCAYFESETVLKFYNLEAWLFACDDKLHWQESYTRAELILCLHNSRI